MSEADYLYEDILRDNNKFYDELCICSGYSKEQMIREAKHIRSILTAKRIQEIIDTVPAEWFERVEENAKNTIASFLEFRINHLEEICDMITERRSL